MGLTVSSSSFASNTGKNGIAINWKGASLIIKNSSFEENTSNSSTFSSDAAIFFTYEIDISDESNDTIGEFECSNCTFTNNSGYFCPDIYTADNISQADRTIRF